MKSITVQTDPVTGESFIKLEDLSEFLDISKVDSYELKTTVKDKSLVVKFFDQKGKLIKMKTKKEVK